MKRICSPEQAVQEIGDGASVMIAGFMCCGQPLRVVDALLAKGSKDLTVICNDAGIPTMGVGKLIAAGRVRRLIASHIGLNPVAGQKMASGEMAVELVPQGTLAERIRCGGAGLGGTLTPTGLGTEVAKEKRTVEIDGVKFLLETPLRADFALVKAKTTDRFGNAFVAKSAKNFNAVMAAAGRHVVLETEALVEPGALDPELVSIPGVFINDIVHGGGHA